MGGMRAWVVFVGALPGNEGVWEGEGQLDWHEGMIYIGCYLQ